MMLESIKVSLRIKNTAYDTEINDLIDAGKSDLRLSGVFFLDEEVETDALLKRAVTLYVKANFGYDNPDAPRFNDSYVMLKQHLSLSGDYREPLV